MLILCPDLIDRIDDLAEQVLGLARELKKSDHDKEIEPLIDHLQKESRNLRAIFNEFCWLEMQR